jgi:hypothetical protein
MMENRRIIGNFLLFILIAASSYGATQFSMFLRMHGRSSFNLMPYNIVVTHLLPLLFGMLVRLPALVTRWKDRKEFDLIRFGFQFVPGFSLAVLPLISMVSPISVPLGVIVSQTLFVSFMGFWAGTVLVDCIKGAPISEQSKSMDV